MSDLGNKSHEQLKKYFEAIQNYENEKQEITERIKEIYDAAKNEGFEAKIIRKLIKEAKRDKAARDEELMLLEIYANAVQLQLF